MERKKIKVLFVGVSRTSHGGVTSVLKAYESMPLWLDFDCYWLETQSNLGILNKLYFAVSAYIKAPIIVPRYDIVHFHTIPGISMLVQLPVFLIARLYGKKTIIHLHYGDQLADKKLDRMSLWVMNSSDMIVTLAQKWKNFIEKGFELNTPVCYIYNPVCQHENRAEIRNKQILFAAYFAENKGLNTVLNAFAKIADEYPEWKLIIAGSGPFDRVVEVKKAIRKYRLEDRIIMPGWIFAEKKEELFKNSSVYCLASFAEGFPMSVTESWSWGTPVISTDVGGLSDITVDGDNILMFDKGNADQLADCFRRFINNPDLQKHLSEESLKLAAIMAPELIESAIRDLYYSLV